MRFLLVNWDYQKLADRLYDPCPELAEAPYAEQLAFRLDSLMGTADFYSRELRRRGHECQDLILGRGPLQQAWAQEHGLPPPPDRPPRRWRRRWRILPYPTRWADRSWERSLLERAVQELRPDVLYIMCVPSVTGEFLKGLKSWCGLVVGQHAANLPDRDYRGYDLILSSLPNQVSAFRRLGIPSEPFPLAFSRRVLEQIPQAEKREGVVFVGQLGGAHRAGTALLEELARETPLEIWGLGREELANDSPLRARHRGLSWGRGMYSLLGGAAIGLNRHAGWAAGHANNMRLYETTGMGALLITEEAQGLPELFEPGREVVTYRSPEECIQQVRYYLDHLEEARGIARAGQGRTLREHTYENRAARLERLVKELRA